MLATRTSRIVLVVLFLFATIPLGILLLRRPSSVESATIGTWQTPIMPDGFATVVQFHPDGTCLIRWVDKAGRDTKRGCPPHRGHWWITRGTLLVDASREPDWFDVPRHWEKFSKRWINDQGDNWRFAIHEQKLEFAPTSSSPVPMTRVTPPSPL